MSANAHYIAALEKRVAELEQLLACKNEALGVFADLAMWFDCAGKPWVWSGANEYADPVKFAAHEQERTEPTDTMIDPTMEEKS